MYTLIDPVTSKVEYEGRTTNEKQRQSQHKINPYKNELQFSVNNAHRNLTYYEARGLEHSLIGYYGTLNKGNYRNNQINGISKKNSKYQQYMEAASFLGEETYVGGGITWDEK